MVKKKRNMWDWVQVWKIVLFSTTTRFCDIKQTRNCLLLPSCTTTTTRYKAICSSEDLLEGGRVFNDIHNRGQTLYDSNSLCGFENDAIFIENTV